MEKSQLAQMRAQKHWTLRQAADAVGVSVVTFSRWESGLQKPYSEHVRRLCEIFDATPEQLGLGAEYTETTPPEHPLITALVGNNLTMRLQALAFEPRRYKAVEMQIAVILEEYDAMNGDTVTRREALIHLASLPFIASLRPTVTTQRAEDVITQCSAGIAACWELSRSKDEVGLTLAFEGAAEYASYLKRIVKEATSTQHRKAAAELVAQSAMLQMILGWHLVNPVVAILHGNEAVTYSEIVGDVLLELNALKLLTWAYYYGQYRKDALSCMQKARLLAEHHHLPLYAQSGVDSTLAIAQAYNGISATPALRRAEQTLDKADMPAYMDDPFAAHFTKAGLAFYLQRDYAQAMTMLTEAIDPETLQMKHAMSERFRVEALNVMVLALLKSKDKDKERAKRYWQAAMQGVLHLQSRQRFSEVVTAYDIMEALWPDDREIQESRALITHGMKWSQSTEKRATLQ
jgi:transcriptional regulator with XRE-family HTH domain